MIRLDSHFISNRVRQGRVGEEGFLQRGTEGRAAGAVPDIFHGFLNLVLLAESTLYYI